MLERDFTHPVTSDSNWAKVLATMPWIRSWSFSQCPTGASRSPGPTLRSCPRCLVADFLHIIAEAEEVHTQHITERSSDIDKSFPMTRSHIVRESVGCQIEDLEWLWATSAFESAETI
eukprot:scaffold30122_cov114-Cyclotella_meneghiniana.AAC.3